MIDLHVEELDFTLDLPYVTEWLTTLLSDAGLTTWTINYIFCSDDYLHQINVEYLNHDTYTDIITFPLEVNDTNLTSDIFISIDRIKENANTYQVDFNTELLRVMAHGILHMVGYGDKTDVEQTKMRAAEDNAIRRYQAEFVPRGTE